MDTTTTIRSIRNLVTVDTAAAISEARQVNEEAAYGQQAQEAIDGWLGALAIGLGELN